LTDELYKKSNPYPRPVYDSDINRVPTNDNDQPESSEPRHKPPSKDVDVNVFRQEGSESNRMLTPSTAGVSVTFSAPTYQQNQGILNPSSRQFARKFDQSMDSAGREDVLSLLKQTPGDFPQGKGPTTGDPTNQNPSVTDAEPASEHRTMAAPARWKGRTVR
jgi:hypothetical protein